jgi:hypothetical protein
MKLCVWEWLDLRRGPLKTFHFHRESNPGRYMWWGPWRKVKESETREEGGPRNIYWPGRCLYGGVCGIILRDPTRPRRRRGGTGLRGDLPNARYYPYGALAVPGRAPPPPPQLLFYLALYMWWVLVKQPGDCLTFTRTHGLIESCRGTALNNNGMHSFFLYRRRIYCTFHNPVHF